MLDLIKIFSVPLDLLNENTKLTYNGKKTIEMT